MLGAVGWAAGAGQLAGAGGACGDRWRAGSRAGYRGLMRSLSYGCAHSAWQTLHVWPRSLLKSQRACVLGVAGVEEEPRHPGLPMSFRNPACPSVSVVLCFCLFVRAPLMHVLTRVKVMLVCTRGLQVTMASSGTALKRMCLSLWPCKAFSPANL